MNHLTPDELIDAVEGTLGRERQSHLEECATCGADAARLRTILRDASAVPVPEPSPLFWDHFSARVHDAIAAEASLRARWTPEWLRWPVLAPLAALALLIMAVASAIPREPLQPAQIAAVTPTDAATELADPGDEPWAVVSEIVGPVAIEDAQDAGLVRLGDAERAALQLNDAEQRELVRLLQEEMEKAGG